MVNFCENRYIESDWFDVFPLGYEEPGEKQWLDDTEKGQGDYNDTNVSYFINSFRYRDEIKPAQGQDAAFGCSNTFGQGVNIAWPRILDLANCASCGISNDHIARTAVSYILNYNPKNIYILWTYTERREYIDEQTGLVKIGYFDEGKKYGKDDWRYQFALLNHNKWNEYNLAKNRLLVESVCKANNCNLKDFHIEGYQILDRDNTEVLNIDNYTRARDDMHPGPYWHVNLAASY